MADARGKFLKILKAELEDLREDIDEAECRHTERFARAEITDYVYRENDALFRREAESLARLADVVDEIDISGYKTVADVAEALDARIKESVKDFEDPEAIYLFVARKLRKVRTYVESGDCP